MGEGGGVWPMLTRGVIKGNTVGPGFQNTGIKDVIGDGVCIDGNTVTGNGAGISISTSAGSVVTNNISNIEKEFYEKNDWFFKCHRFKYF